MKLNNNGESSQGSASLLIEMIERRERQGLARSITLVESNAPEKEFLLDYAYKKNVVPTLVVGITGPGGVGKSTLIDKMISEYRSQGKTVGVIAVDPSSPLSGGAFLGDRVRMGSHNIDHEVFMRSFSSRGSHGGISEAAKDALYLYKAFGFDVIILESLGVGQDETEITMFVDINVLILVPGLGDIMQMFKAGVREVADVFIVNKADKPEAEIAKEMLINSFGVLSPESRPPILSTVASEGMGIIDVVAAIEKTAKTLERFTETKRRERIRAEIASTVLSHIRNSFQAPVNSLTEQVLSGKLTPFEASRRIMEEWRLCFIPDAYSDGYIEFVSERNDQGKDV